jgi:hypothetical protein
VRGIRWGASERVLLRYSARRITIICGALLFIWFVVSLNDLQHYQLSDFVSILFALSFLASLALDYTSMTSALGSINGEIIAGRWDLLRISLITIPQIVAAKHGAAQVRAWRLMVTIIALRLAVLLMGVISILLILVHTGTFAFIRPADLILELSLVIAFGLVYLIEPWWRMRTVTALGVAISARTRAPVSAVLAAGGMVFGIWLLQGLIVFALALALTIIIVPLAFAEYSVLETSIIAPLMFIALVVVTVYGFYSIIQVWGLRRAERWIAQASR